MIASPCSFERRWIVEKVLGLRPRYLRASSCTLSEVVDQLSTPSLFGGAEWLVYDEIECVKKKLSDLAGHSHLILSGTRVEKGPFLTLDLTKEKPWEKKDRFLQFAMAEMQRRGKRLAPDAAALLVENVDGDLARLFGEVEKLSIYAADEGVVERSTVMAVGSGKAAVLQWGQAESLALEGRCPREVPFTDASGFHQFIGQLRYHLRVGLKLALGENVEGVRPKTVSKYGRLAKKKGPAHFQQGLEALFHAERKAKTTPIDPKILYTHFVAKTLI